MESLLIGFLRKSKKMYTYKKNIIVARFKPLKQILFSLANLFQLILLRYYKDKKIVMHIRKAIKNGALLTPNDLFMVYSLAKSRSRLEGSMVEVGVYKGDSAKMICEAKRDKKLYLFDTFEGIPYADKEKDILFRKNEYKSTINYVKNYLRKYPNVFIYEGIFPESSKPIEKESFCFVHLDVDVYKSTLDSLNFFYPRMVKEGIILSHDYSQAEGVKIAISTFFDDKPESIIELTGSQCMIIKNGGTL